jgi:hypothetical protein
MFSASRKPTGLGMVSLSLFASLCELKLFASMFFTAEEGKTLS